MAPSFKGKFYFEMPEDPFINVDAKLILQNSCHA